MSCTLNRYEFDKNGKIVSMLKLVEVSQTTYHLFDQFCKLCVYCCLEKFTQL